MYIKECLFPYVEIIPHLAYSDETSEELWIALCNPGWKKTLIGLIYRPPSGKPDIFTERMVNTLDKLNVDYNSLSRDLIILGDFRIDFGQTQTPAHSRLKTVMGDGGLRQIIKVPTRVTNKAKSTIDLIFTNISPSLITPTHTIEALISDHKPIFLNKKAKRPKHITKSIIRRNYRNSDKDHFGYVLHYDHAWHDFWANGGEPDKLWEIITSILLRSMDILYPRRKVTLRNDQHPWVGRELQLELPLKNKQFKKPSTLCCQGIGIIFIL